MTSQSKPTRKGKSPQRGETDAHRFRCEKNLSESNPAHSRIRRLIRFSTHIKSAHTRRAVHGCSDGSRLKRRTTICHENPVNPTTRAAGECFVPIRAHAYSNCPSVAPVHTVRVSALRVFSCPQAISAFIPYTPLCALLFLLEALTVLPIKFCVLCSSRLDRLLIVITVLLTGWGAKPLIGATIKPSLTLGALGVHFAQMHIVQFPSPSE